MYPQTALPLVVQIAPGADSARGPGDWTWVDVTDYVSLANGNKISITEGRGDWGSKSDPGSIAVTFKNTTGDFSEYNPLGRWYGLLGRDTPLRVRIRRGEDSFTRTASGSWGTSDSGQAWTQVAGTPANWSVGSGVGRVAFNTVNDTERMLYGATLLDSEQRMSITPSAALTGASLVWRSLFRYENSSYDGDHYSCSVELDRNTGSGLTITCKIRRMQSFAEQTLVTGTAGLYTAGQPVHMRAGIAGQHLGVKAWTGTLADEPAGWTCEIDDYAITKPGRAGIDGYLVFGNTNTLPYVLTVDNWQLDVDLAGGFVPTWAPSWDRSRKDRTVSVTAKGILYRLQPATGKTPPKSPIRRIIEGTNPVAYLPLEDGTAATQAGSAISGQFPAVGSGTVTFDPIGEIYTANLYSYIRPGMIALANITSGGSLSAQLPAEVTAATTSLWCVHVFELHDDASAFSGDLVVLEWATPGGTYARWRLVVTTLGHTQVIAYNAAGAATTVCDDSGNSPDGGSLAVAAFQSGGNISVSLFRNITTSASVAGTLAGITSITVNPTGATAPAQIGIGQIAIWAATTVPFVRSGLTTDVYGELVPNGYNSWPVEAVTERLIRLAAEDRLALNIPVRPVYPDDVTRMNFQPVATPSDLYQQCVDADGGILYERPFRLEYAARVALYNQTPAMSATFEQLGEEPEPDPTDQAYRNRIEAKRTEGSSAVAETPDVTAGNAIVYDDQIELSVVYDAVLPNHAWWRLWLASRRGLRWPKLPLNLAATPELIDAWLCCRPGSRIQVTAPPDDVTGQDVDVLLQGHTTTLGYKDWTITANCSPAAGWDVATVGGTQRTSTDGSTLASTLTTGAMSVSLASTTAGGLWTTDPSDFPMPVVIGGEAATASAISGTSSPQTMTLSARGVNGITRSWPAGTQVNVRYPAVVAL